MIELLIKNELTLKRYRRFKRRKLAVISIVFILIFTFLSFTAEFWANSKPLVMKWKGEIYYPIFRSYHPKIFGITDSLTMNYRELTKSDDDWMIWPLISWDPFESNLKVDSFPSEPTKDNLLGTDDRGRDILSRLLYGFRYSILYAISVWLVTYIVGVIAGSIMGYWGGKVDFFGQRIVEILNTVPQFFLLIIIISIFTPNLWLLVLISSLFGWISISYYLRGEFLKNRKKEFVEAARSMGASHLRIIFKHILPNSLAPVITFSPFVIAGNIVALAGLDYLGFGLTPPTPSWGELLSQAQKHFSTGWWLAFYPSLALFGTLTALALVGEGVRDALDPHLT